MCQHSDTQALLDLVGEALATQGRGPSDEWERRQLQQAIKYIVNDGWQQSSWDFEDKHFFVHWYMREKLETIVSEVENLLLPKERTALVTSRLHRMRTLITR